MAVIKLYDSDGRKKDEDEENVLFVEKEEVFVDDNRVDKRSLFNRFSSFFLVRTFICIVSAFCFLYLFYVIFKLSIVFFFSSLTLFRMESLRKVLFQCFENFKMVSIGLVGLFIALFSPSLGVTIVTAYCMMNLNDHKNSFLLRFLETRLRGFEKD